MKSNKKTVAFYLRVSTDEQAVSGFGLDLQREKLEAMATLHDYETKKDFIYIDEGFSGTLSPDKRPALSKLLSDARKHKFEVVVVYRVDRLARDNFYTIGIARELNELNIIFQSATEPFDTSNSFGNFMLQFLGATAEMDRKNILERTQGGRIQSAKKGNWVFGTPPYGYTYNKDTKKLELHKEQGEWVQKFFEWLVYEKCSLKEIARRANNLKVETELQADGSLRKATGLWYPRTLGRLLTNDAYTGQKYINKYKTAHRGIKNYENKNYMKDESEWILVRIPQIISKDLFDEAIAQLRKNSDFALRKKKRDYMFSGLVHCSECKLKLRGVFATPKSETSKGSRRYFGIKSKNDSPNTKKCDYCGSIAESRLMPIWYALENILTNPEVAYKQLRKHTSKDRVHEFQEKLKLIKSEVSSLYRERNRLNKAFLDFGSIEEKEYQFRLKKIEKRLKELALEKTRFNNLEITEKEKDRRVNVIGNLYKQFNEKLTNASYETRMQILRLFVDRIDLNLAMNIAQISLNFSSADVLKDNRRG